MKKTFICPICLSVGVNAEEKASWIETAFWENGRRPELELWEGGGGGGGVQGGV